jgi:hypothetical protein
MDYLIIALIRCHWGKRWWFDEDAKEAGRRKEKPKLDPKEYVCT